jgi:DNA modification methylase
VRDRLTVSHEYLFMMTKSEKYSFHQDAIKETRKDGNGFKNKRTVWSINTEPFPEAHFAVFPSELVRPCIQAGSKENDIILDPFFGAGTVGLAALDLRRRCVGIELKPDYIEIAKRRLAKVQLNLGFKSSELKTSKRRERDKIASASS